MFCALRAHTPPNFVLTVEIIAFDCKMGFVFCFPPLHGNQCIYGKQLEYHRGNRIKHNQTVDRCKLFRKFW